MSNRFLPIAGITVALAIIVYLALSFVFPHKVAVIVDTQTKAVDVFSAELNEADAQATATVVDPSGAAPPAASTEADAAEPVAAPAAEEPAAEPVAESAAVAAPSDPVTAEAPVAESAAAEPPAASTASPGLSRAQLAKIVAEAAAKAAAETAKSIAEQATRDAAGH